MGEESAEEDTDVAALLPSLRAPAKRASTAWRKSAWEGGRACASLRSQGGQARVRPERASRARAQGYTEAEGAGREDDVDML